ncbi:MAG: biotin transporter BioY [Clostridiales Family XIII bacterium]|jgi:biotin transport system substrate-specific component|nr:biotin transporter BioY [Clostridiales Family XIII bacterium]
MKINIRTKDLVLTAIFAAITCILSILEIPIEPVPITLGVFATVLSGLFLKPAYAFISQLIHILLGAIGLPVFGGGTGGAGIIAGPTGGYILATPMMSLIISLGVLYAIKHLNKKFPNTKNIDHISVIIVMSVLIASVLFCYIIGTMQFMGITNMGIMESLALCVIPFIPFDAGKIIIAGLLFLAVYKRIKIFD